MNRELHDGLESAFASGVNRGIALLEDRSRLHPELSSASFLSFISKGWPSNLTLLISRSISRLASITAIVRDCEFTTSLKLWSSENLYLLLNTFKTQLRNIRKRALTSAACLQVHEIEHLINYRGIIIS